MLDVVHFFFEEDSRYRTAEEAKSVEALRVSLYETMYQTKYNYRSNANNNSNSTYSNSSPTDTNVTKPYIPPTDFDPISGLPLIPELEAPLG